MNSPIKWFGGKGHLTQHIIPHMPQKYTTYVEPFGGGASLLFAKVPSTVEVYNDMDAALVNFFRILRFRGDEFVKRANLLLHSRKEFMDAKREIKRYRRQDMWTVESMDAALDFFVMGRQSISGTLNKGGWSYGVTKSAVNPWLNAVSKLPEIVSRFREVQVEHLDAIKCIEKYDRVLTFFYVDPPYTRKERSEHRYRVDFNNHADLLYVLVRAKGMVLLSGYHNSLYDERLKDWHVQEISTVSQATPTNASTGILGEGALKKDHSRTEVLWWNDNLQNMGNQLQMF